MNKLAQKKKAFTMHFRSTDCPLIFIEFALHSQAYGQFDYYILQEQDSTRAFLSEKGLKQAYEFGNHLVDSDFSKRIIKSLEGLNKELEDITLVKKIKNTPVRDLNNLYDELKEKVMLICKLYLYCEQPVLSSLEEIIQKAVPDKGRLIKILKNPGLDYELNLSKKEKNILNTLVNIGKLKFSIHTKLGPWFEALYEVIEKISKQYNIALNKALMLRDEDIKQAILGKSPNGDLLESRLGGCVLLSKDNKDNKKWRCLTGNDFKVWKRRLEPDQTQQIKGVIAYPGKARGPVKLHLSFIKTSAIPKGSVLVSGMTNPQIVPFLKNVAAIITDEGGLTCHAAIISRELKIPCIVGTKIATTLLKEGDLVEVDADKGEVNIIKKMK